MAIIREKRRNNFTVLDDRVLQDRRLSLLALGIFAYIKSMPEDWDITVDNLAAGSKHDDKATIQSGLDELEKAGYLFKSAN